MTQAQGHQRRRAGRNLDSNGSRSGVTMTVSNHRKMARPSTSWLSMYGLCSQYISSWQVAGCSNQSSVFPTASYLISIFFFSAEGVPQHSVDNFLFSQDNDRHKFRHDDVLCLLRHQGRR
eukprot:scaffold25954_cov83-Skeletonema_dohrnii-CCMP3373.AAC.2